MYTKHILTMCMYVPLQCTISITFCAIVVTFLRNKKGKKNSKYNKIYTHRMQCDRNITFE